MQTETSLTILGTETPYKLIVEPWANEYEIHPNDHCTLLVKHEVQGTVFAVEPVSEGGIMVWVELTGATYQFWRNGKLEEENHNAIPPTPKLGGSQ